MPYKDKAKQRKAARESQKRRYHAPGSTLPGYHYAYQKVRRLNAAGMSGLRVQDLIPGLPTVSGIRPSKTVIRKISGGAEPAEKGPQPNSHQSPAKGYGFSGELIRRIA